jgi:hypothetical protein
LSGNLTAPTILDTTKAQFKLQKSAFDNTNGEIISFALFVVTKQSNNADKSYGFWNGTDATWPSAPGEAVQLTPNLWNPFESTLILLCIYEKKLLIEILDGSDTVDFLIGNDTECSNANYCNRALSEDTEYYLIVRGLTSAAFKDSGLLHFKTGKLTNVIDDNLSYLLRKVHVFSKMIEYLFLDMPDDPRLGLILGLTFGLLVLLIIILILLFWWRRKRKT